VRIAAGLAAVLFSAAAAAAAGSWRVVSETPAVRVEVDLSRLERQGSQITFRERQTFRAGQTDPHTLRPLREALATRVIDCRKRRLATLSRAVFDTHDALIDHQAQRLRDVAWQALAPADPYWGLLCGDSSRR
jgi:hypothetical protein